MRPLLLPFCTLFFFFFVLPHIPCDPSFCSFALPRFPLCSFISLALPLSVPSLSLLFPCAPSYPLHSFLLIPRSPSFSLVLPHIPCTPSFFSRALPPISLHSRLDFPCTPSFFFHALPPFNLHSLFHFLCNPFFSLALPPSVPFALLSSLPSQQGR